MKHHLILTCEHAGNHLPAGYPHLFSGDPQALDTHEGWDPGALDIAQYIAHQLQVPLFQCNVSRLLIEVNRSVGHPQLFSRFTQLLPDREKEYLVQKIYFPYRNKIEAEISSSPKPVFHLSVHTFTPVWHGATRNVDIGLLFDPSRKRESEICKYLVHGLALELPAFEIKFNKPYKGVDDGFTTYLRTQFADTDYAGIELEINQKWVGGLPPVTESIAKCLKELC